MKNNVVFITGCSSGIGRALALSFHNRGFRVVATARQIDSLNDLAAKGMAVHSLDVTDEKRIDQVISSVLEEEKRIDILVNNAGYGLMSPVIEVSEEELDRQFRTNVVGPLVLAQKVAADMKGRGSGIIVNIGSISGLVTMPFSGAYCASKAALHMLSDAMRMELSPFGIQVVTVQPGSVKSEFGNTADRLVSRILKPNSWYLSIENAIRMRAGISQENATPAEKFAEKLVAAVTAESPPAVIRLGKMSTVFPLMKDMLPIRILDAIFKKKFGLNQIGKA